jgi:hypothetical protein
MYTPSTVGEALAAVRAGLAFLSQVAAAELPGVVQADCLRELARVESAYTAAHAWIQWGWVLALNTDGTITALSPDRTRTLHSHGPPSRAA